MKSINRKPSLHRVLALLLASAACSAWSSAHAAGAADAGTRDFTSEEKLLGGPDTYGAGYADPYGQAPGANGANGANRAKAAGAATSAEKMMTNNADPTQTNASFVTPGSVAMKRGARVQVKDATGTPEDAAQSVYGTTGLKPAGKKTTEIYRSPY